MGPVRIGNSAYTQIQNDGYGSVILASTQSIFDSRLENPGDVSLFEKLEGLGHQAVRLWNRPDAGLWELRTPQQVHTYSAVMCWAACDRLDNIAPRLYRHHRAAAWATEATESRIRILDAAGTDRHNSLAYSRRTVGSGNWRD